MTTLNNLKKLFPENAVTEVDKGVYQISARSTIIRVDEWVARRMKQLYDRPNMIRATLMGYGRLYGKPFMKVSVVWPYEGDEA